MSAKALKKECICLFLKQQDSHCGWQSGEGNAGGDRQGQTMQYLAGYGREFTLLVLWEVTGSREGQADWISKVLHVRWATEDHGTPTGVGVGWDPRFWWANWWGTIALARYAQIKYVTNMAVFWPHGLQILSAPRQVGKALQTRWCFLPWMQLVICHPLNLEQISFGLSSI